MEEPFEGLLQKPIFIPRIEVRHPTVDRTPVTFDNNLMQPTILGCHERIRNQQHWNALYVGK